MAKVKVRGKGSVYKMERGKSRGKCRKWQLRAEIDGEFEGDEGYVKTRVFHGTYSEAQDAKDEFVAAIERGEVRRERGMLFPAYAEAWLAVSATAKSAERATLSRRRRPRFPAGGATALWPPALPRAAAQGALDRGVVEVRGPDLNLQRRGALGVPGRDRPARDLPSAELREPDRHRDVLCAERGQPPRGVRGPHDCPLSGSPSPSAASASRSFMR